jgi:nicotinamidase-related amidase
MNAREPAAGAVPWGHFISADDERRYAAAGFGKPVGMGTRPALLIIDVQYRTVGNSPKPFFSSLEDYPTSCGDTGWAAVAKIAELLEVFRRDNLPVLYPFVAPKQAYDAGRLGAKVPAIMTVSGKGYEFVDAIRPRPEEIVLPKRHPSAFFGTPLVSYLIDLGVDTLVVTGCTTSGCVRSTAVDAFAYNFRVTVPADAVYDRAASVHEVNLFDLAQKYADVLSTADVIAAITGMSGIAGTAAISADGDPP